MKQLLAIIGLVLFVGTAGAQNKGPDQAARPSHGLGHGTVKGIAIDATGTVGASAKFGVNMPWTMAFPAGLIAPTPASLGTSVTCGTNPGQTDTWTVKCNAVSEGTFTVSSSCVGAFTGISAFTCLGQQRLEIDGPASFSTSAPADEFFTLMGLQLQ